MRLYEIDNAIRECVDEETGEVIDIDRLEELQIQRGEKVESVACWIKNLLAYADAIKVEKQALEKRESQARNKVDQLKNWLEIALSGQTLCTPRVAIRYRRSQIIELDAVFDVPQEYVHTKIENHVDKNALKKAIKAGAAFEGVRLVERKNIQIS